MDTKLTLTEAFGTDGAALYGVARKLAGTYMIDVEDVAAEVMVAALEVKASYGFVHINTVANHVKNAFRGTSYSDFSAYAAGQGAGVVNLEALAEQEDSEEAADVVLTDGGAAWAEAELSIEVRQALSGLSEQDRRIAAGFASGLTLAEIAQGIGCHLSTVSKRKAVIAQALQGVL